MVVVVTHSPLYKVSSQSQVDLHRYISFLICLLMIFPVLSYLHLNCLTVLLPVHLIVYIIIYIWLFVWAGVMIFWWNWWISKKDISSIVKKPHALLIQIIKIYYFVIFKLLILSQTLCFTSLSMFFQIWCWSLEHMKIDCFKSCNLGIWKERNCMFDNQTSFLPHIDQWTRIDQCLSVKRMWYYIAVFNNY